MKRTERVLLAGLVLGAVVSSAYAADDPAPQLRLAAFLQGRNETSTMRSIGTIPLTSAFFSDLHPAREPTLLGDREMAGHAIDFGIVDPVGCQLVVRAEAFENGGTAKDEIRLIGTKRGRGRRQRQREYHPDAASRSYLNLP